MTGTRSDDVEYVNSNPAEDFQEFSKHERAERGSALESTKGFEFCDFPLIKSLVTQSRFYSLPLLAYTPKKFPSTAKNTWLRDGHQIIVVRLTAEVRNRLFSGASMQALGPKKYPIQ